jgi:S1/P1 Nuclease
MRRNFFPVLTLILTLVLPQTVLAWNATGHQVVAGIAWDNMSPTARQNAIALLQAAPSDACLLELFPNDSRPIAERQREFFMRASTWPDIVRPSEEDTRACTRFHRRDWHFINYFWEGTSDPNGTNAHDREDIEMREVNAVERLTYFRPLVACGTPACGTPLERRARTLAWIIHLVGDIHQPLHTSARVTSRPLEREGDQGGNLFKLGTSSDSLSLHSYWDGIIDRADPRRPDEMSNNLAYLNRIIGVITQEHPRSPAIVSRLRSGDFEAWSLEGFETTKRVVYPPTLERGHMPSVEYRGIAFKTAKESIALAGYRLADLLNTMLGSAP